MSSAATAVSVWFKTATASGVLIGLTSALPSSCGQTCLATTAMPLLWIGANGHLNGYGTCAGSLCTPLSSPVAVNNGAWHQAVLVPGQALYLDGAKVASGTATFPMPASADALLGAGLIPQNALYAQWSYFNGALADLSIYQNQLPSVGTVAAQYAAETQPAAELNSVTTPAGRTELAATYDTANDRVATLTDATGGTWTYGVPVPGASAAAYGDAVMASSPMDFWPFNDTAGPLAQDVVGATATAASPRPPASYLNVTLGMAGPTGFADGGAARFNGSTSQVSIPGGYFSGTGAESVELWFSTTATSGNLLSSHTGTGGEPLALWLSQGCLAGSVGSAVVGGPIFGACTTGSVADGKWHQAVLSVGPPVASAQGTATQAVTVYVDGAVVASTPVPAASTPAPAGYTVWVGNGPSGAFAGSIADLSLYSKKLTATEVTGHFNALHNQISVQLPSTNPFLPPSYLTTPIINDQTLTVTDPLGKSTTYLYVNGALTQITNPLGGVTSYGYDASGRASTVTGPAGDTTYTTFDAHNNVTSVTTCAVVNSCQTSYAGYFENLLNPLDPRNDKPTDQRDPRSSSPYDPAYDTVTGYTPAGEVAFRKSPPTTACPSGCRRSYAYSTGTEAAIGGGTQPAGLLASSTAPGGAVTSYAYDSAGDVMQVTDPAGLVTRYTYDSLGRELTQTQISDSYPGGLTDSYTYDGLDRPVTQSDAPVTDRVTGAVHTKTSNFTYDPDSGVLTATVSDPTGGDPSRTVTNTYNAHGELASVTDPRGNTITYTYDALGDRASETDPAGVTTVYTYDSAGDLLTATLRGYTGDPGSPSPPTDLVLQSRSYDPAGRLASATNVKGTTAYYTYYGNNQLASTAVVATGSTARQQVTTYAYDPAGNLTTETDPGGLVTTTVYNAAGQVVSQAQDPGGANRTVTAGYDADGDVVAASTTRGSVTRNVTATYDAMDRVLSRTVEDGASGLTTTVTRDRRGLPISVTDPAGNTTLIANDEVGRPVVVTGTPVPTQAGPGAPVIARPVTMTGYDTYSDHVEYADANGNVTTATYDTDGLLVSVTDPTYTPPGATAPVNGTSTFAYNGLGQQTKATDPLGRTTTTSYDQLGNMCGQIDPSGGVWTYTYDPAGEQTSVTDPTGARTQATYDGFGHLVTTTNLVRQNGSAAYTTSYAYNDAGEQVSRTTPTGEKTAAAYNALGELTSVTDPAGDTATFTWNLYGSLAKATLPDGSGLTESYDPAGRPLSLSELDGTGTVLRTASVGYDANGDVTSATDFRGTTSTATYDASGALLSVTQPVSAGQSVTTRYGYDLAGNRTALTGGNGNTTYTTYNSLGLPETTVEPPTAAHGSVADSTTTGSYNADGELVTQYLPGGVQVNNTYDAMGALTSQSGTGASAPTATRTFSYDAAGRLLAAASGAAGTPGTFGYQQATIESFTYDDRGLLLSASGAAGTSTFGYDAAGRLATATDAAGTSTYTYDSAGRLATDADAASGITGTYGYNTLDQLVRISYGTGNNSRSFGYDSLHRLASDTVTTAGGAQVARIGYGYNGNDDLTTVTTSGLAAPGGTGTVANTYGYDQSDRLTSWTASPASGSPTTRTYGYDADGNLVNNNGVAQTYDARDELVSDGNGNTYSYTADGDLLNQVSPGPGGTTTWTSSSDAYGQQSTGGSASSYTYDALGRLVSVGKLLDNTYAIPLTYDGMTDNVASDTSARYSRDPTGDLVGVATSGGGRLLALSNRHGDVSGLFTATGSGLTGSTTYDPWGGVLATTGPTIQLGYQGQWTDPVTQQVDMGARFYRPRTGGFANQDTYTNGEGGAAVTDNPHAYADDNPLSVADPTGHSPSNGGGTNGTITLADVQAAQARAASAEHRAASAESAARTAWSVAASAGRAASADAAEARALNSEAASLLREYNSVSGQANAAFADARREASIAAQDRLEADSLKAQEYTTVPVYSTRLVAVGGASTSTSIKCGVGIGPAVGDTLTLTGGCQVTGGSGGSIQFEAVTVQTGTKKVKNQAIADRIAALERAADAAARESDRDTNRGMGLTWKAIGIYAQYETTREEAAVAAGRAAEAASYAIQTRQRAQYLSQVAASDEAAAHKAEAEYRACERKYQQEQRQEKHRAKPHKHGPEHLKNPPAPRSPRVTRTPPAPRLPHVTKTPPAPPLTLTTVTPPAPRLPLTTATPPVSHGVTVNADSGDDENAGEESPEDDGFDPDDPNDDLGAAARSARDERGKGGKRGAYIGGYDPATGDVATGESGPDGCAENACEEELGGGPAQPKFTKAFGWRKGVWREIPTCIRCQGRYSREQFPPDVTFDPGGPWSQ